MTEVRLREYGFVYGIRSLDLIKVGVATDIEKRMNVMRLHNPHGVELVFYRRVYAPYVFEKRLHQLLAEKAMGREWFKISLEELRCAAVRARSSSAREQRITQRLLSVIPENVTPVTQEEKISNEIMEIGQ
jgi:hypothetical protein